MHRNIICNMKKNEGAIHTTLGKDLENSMLSE